MGTRIELQEMLEQITPNVYYQPPSTISIKYPFIVYTRRSIETDKADNGIYREKRSYSLTVIDKNPDSPIVDKIARLPYSGYDRHFVSDGLNHDTFTLYY